MNCVSASEHLANIVDEHTFIPTILCQEVLLSQQIPGPGSAATFTAYTYRENSISASQLAENDTFESL